MTGALFECVIRNHRRCDSTKRDCLSNFTFSGLSQQKLSFLVFKGCDGLGPGIGGLYVLVTAVLWNLFLFFHCFAVKIPF